MECGLGLGIIGSIAYDHERDQNLRQISAEHLFEKNTTRIAVRRGHFLRDFAYDFIERLAPRIEHEELLSKIASAAKVTA